MMTREDLESSRNSVDRLRGYSKGLAPKDPLSFPRYVQDELGLKVAPTIQNLIAVIKALDQRLRDLEGDP